MSQDKTSITPPEAGLQLAYGYYVPPHAFDKAVWSTAGQCGLSDRPRDTTSCQGNEPAPLTCRLGSHHSNPLRQLAPQTKRHTPNLLSATCINDILVFYELSKI